ncbi:LysR family transcriptional regulator [Chitinophaga eiseniae]|uniref:LysR family transcriptional regulator n=1 Tax=Chitinophaga eiseniae TaxID=634771 RepID=A0A847SQD0_9BACT|nr:LysR family transcriptional regulator [Chitinophaga eiseniae]NLR80128.1 LysR family transcriptional regulator [Chitinophaga eiseniae]
MEIRHLKLVKAIVEEGSMAKAINKLYLTSSALSHQLREAEYQLGTPIFNREGKKMTLTAAGEKLYESAKVILEKIEVTEKEIKQIISGQIGKIRITTECYTGYSWLALILQQFQAVFPDIDVQIVTEAANQSIKNLLDGTLDIAVVSDVEKHEKVKYIDLFQDEIVMVVSENHPWTDKKYVIAEDFANEHLYIHSLPVNKVSLFQFLLTPANITPKKVTPLPLTEASLTMVECGMGVMSMAKWAVQPFIKNHSIKTVKIGRTGLKRKHYIAILKDQSYPEYFYSFIEFCQKKLAIKS